MNKLTQIFAAIALSVGFVGNVAGAQASPDPVCTSIVITNPGQSSNNSGTCVVNTTVTVSCTNNIYVLSQNDQTAVTGQASSLGNTSGGPAITGDATNSNGTNVQIGAACGSTHTTPETPNTTPTASTTPTGGSGQAEAKHIAALPYTASSSVVELAAVGTVVLLISLVATRIGFALYRRTSLK